MSKVNMHRIIALWEFSRSAKKDRESFIQKALKVCKTYKLNSLKRPKFDIPQRKTVYNLFYCDMQEKKELKGATVCQANAIISRELKNVKGNNKEMKKYIDLYEVEKRLYKNDL